jgi:hypothetical protein
MKEYAPEGKSASCPDAKNPRWSRLPDETYPDFK